MKIQRVKKVILAAHISMARLLKAIIIVASMMLTFNLFIDVIMRYIVRKPLLGIEEFAPIFALWLYFVGASYGSYEHSHVYAGLLHVLLKERQFASRITTAVTSVITFSLSCYVIILSYQLLRWVLASGKSSLYLRLSGAYSISAVFLGFVLMSFYFLIDAIRDSRVALKSENATVVRGGPG